MYDINNTFALIISGKICSKKIYEDDQLIAIPDINPVAPVHILVITKHQCINYEDFVLNCSPDHVRHFFTTIPHIAQILKLSDGYRIITNNGEKSGQTIFHFHVHIIGDIVLTSLI